MKSMKTQITVFYTNCLWIRIFFQIFIFIGTSVIYLSLSEIPIWTHQMQFGLSHEGEGSSTFYSTKTLNALKDVKILLLLLANRFSNTGDREYGRDDH
jgi:hypothetical protein